MCAPEACLAGLQLQGSGLAQLLCAGKGKGGVQVVGISVWGPGPTDIYSWPLLDRGRRLLLGGKGSWCPLSSPVLSPERRQASRGLACLAVVLGAMNPESEVSPGTAAEGLDALLARLWARLLSNTVARACARMCVCVPPGHHADGGHGLGRKACGPTEKEGRAPGRAGKGSRGGGSGAGL